MSRIIHDFLSDLLFLYVVKMQKHGMRMKEETYSGGSTSTNFQITN